MYRYIRIIARQPEEADEVLLLQPTRIVPRKCIERSIELAHWVKLPAAVVITHASGDEGNAYQLLAEVHRKLGETKQERRVLSDLATVSSDAAYAYGRLMEICTEQKDWHQVVENGQRYLAVYPLLATVHGQMGRANEELGRDEQAIESYQRLLLLDPADPADVNYRLARLLRHQADVSRHRVRRDVRELYSLAGDRLGVVTDPLQLDVQAQHRGYEPQVPRARKVKRDERVAAPVEGPDLPVNRQVADDRLGGERPVARQQRVDRVLQRRIDHLRHVAETFTDSLEIALEPFFVMCHNDSGQPAAPSRRRRPVPSCHP